MPMHY